MGSKQSVLQEKGYTVMSEQDNEIMVKNNDGDQFVIKKLNANQNEASDFLQKLNHPHIVHHKEIIKDGDCLYLVMELCEGGDVSQKIKDKKKETEILDWTVKICMALKHLHDQQILHKNLQPKNEASGFIQKLNHPHIVDHKEIIKDRDCLYIVMELCEGGDVSQKIKDKKKETEILDWTVKICMALKHLHDQQILHKNLQPKSLFFTACGTIRLGEFGVIHEWSSGTQTANTEALSYIAPEILKGGPYDEKSEIWNLGCIIYEMCMQKCAEKRTADIIPKILNGSYEALPMNFSEDLRQLVKDTLQIDPANRPSVNEILMRPFLIQHLYEMSTKTVNKLNVCKNDEEATNESEDSQEAPVESQVSLKVLEELADGLERVHFNTTVGSLAGGVVGLAGGITSIVGLILTPFTLGASLIVTGVGIGVAVAGGVASGVSNITKMVNQRSDRQKVKLLITDMQEKITSTSYCIQNIQIAVETQRLLSESNESWLNAQSGENTLISAGARLGRGLGGVAELVRLAQVTSVGRIAAQTARVVRVAEVATGVLTGLFVAVDIFFVALDSKEIHNIRRDSASTNKKEQELRSEIMKFVNKIRETKKELKEILNELKVALQSLEPQIPN
ncbi:Serine/threonine-protein kinase Nek1 [Labeo rohita]|uniref:non-specific serine/threonine protein kinase n=1 Tax=Labeo rohita TaxID=84645 RepID=A0ABQ8L838_LABRO|nr:Serine/threonine-protein kinase Nek1 [Labeo rohita]